MGRPMKRSRIVRIAVAVAAMFALGAASLSTALPAAADGSTGSISGTVTAADGGAALAGICVTATPPGGETGSATTASDGSYTISGLAPNSYSVEFSIGCGNTGNYAPQWWDGAASQTSGTPVSITGGSTIGSIDAQLVTGGTISGTVTAAEGGAPLAGICVAVDGPGYGQPGFTPAGTAVTASDGTYTVTGLAQNQYTVEFSEGCGNSGGYGTQWWEDASSAMSASDVQVNTGSTVGSIDAQLVVGGAISGSVTAAVGGAELSGACVQASLTTATGQALRTFTADDGSYSFDGLNPGSYDVEFLDGSACMPGVGGPGAFESQWFDDASTQASATAVPVVSGGSVGSIDAQMVVGGTISGTVTAAVGGAPLQGICVSVANFPTPFEGTASDGTYTVAGLPTGSYTVQFSNGCGNPGSFAPQSVLASVVAPSATTGVNVQMEPGTAPTVTSVTPDSGSESGGTQVTITGTGFTGATGVQFGFTPSGPFMVMSDTEIVTTSPMGPLGTVDVKVSTSEGTSSPTTSDQFTYTPMVSPPSVGSVTPNSGPLSGGTPVTITGTGFTGATQVRFGPNPPVPFMVVSGTEITTTSPMGAPGPVDVQVTGPGGTSMTSPGDQFTYEGSTTPPPTVSSITPDSGPEAGGTPVTITGVNFSGTTGVMFGPNAASSFTVVSGTEITAVSPPQTFGGPMEVTVTTPGGMSNMSPGSQFTYDIAPFIMGAAGVGFVAGAPDSVTLSTSGYPAPVLTVGPGLPSWMAVSSSPGQMTLSGTPPLGTRHVYELTVSAVISVGTATRTETITVGSAPVITSADAVTFHSGASKTFRISAKGYPVPYVTVTGTLPAGVSATPAAGIVTLSGVPAPGSGGVYPVTVVATSATGTTQQTLVITVDEKAIFTGPTTATWIHGTSNSLTVTTSGAYPADTLKVKGALPSWATFTDNGNGSGTLSGEPGAGAVRPAPYRVTIVASNGLQPVAQTFSLTVQ